MKYLPYLLFVAALGAAYAYREAQDPTLKMVTSGFFAVLLGAAGILWGVQELRAGSALIVHRNAFRDDQPIVFWSVILIFRFTIGAVMIAAGLWHLMQAVGA